MRPSEGRPLAEDFLEPLGQLVGELVEAVLERLDAFERLDVGAPVPPVYVLSRGPYRLQNDVVPARGRDADVQKLIWHVPMKCLRNFAV